LARLKIKTEAARSMRDAEGGHTGYASDE